MKRKLLILPLMALLLGTSGCAQKENNYQQYKRYIATLSNDDTPTYEEWLESMKGEDGKDGVAPEISINANGNIVINGVDTGVTQKGEKGEKGPKGETGDKGEKGDKGESGENAITPYELYKSLHPDYSKSEDEFYLDLANGNAGEQVVHTVSFTYNGEEILASQTVVHGEKASNPGAPYMPGLTFVSWTYENEVWNFNASVTEDLVLVAVFA